MFYPCPQSLHRLASSPPFSLSLFPSFLFLCVLLCWLEMFCPSPFPLPSRRRQRRLPPPGDTSAATSPWPVPLISFFLSLFVLLWISFLFVGFFFSFVFLLFLNSLLFNFIIFYCCCCCCCCGWNLFRLGGGGEWLFLSFCYIIIIINFVVAAAAAAEFLSAWRCSLVSPPGRKMADTSHASAWIHCLCFCLSVSAFPPFVPF